MASKYHKEMNQRLLNHHSCNNQKKHFVPYSVFLKVYSYINDKISILNTYDNNEIINCFPDGINTFDYCDKDTLNYNFMDAFCKKDKYFFRANENEFAKYYVNKSALLKNTKAVLKKDLELSSTFKTDELFKKFIVDDILSKQEDFFLQMAYENDYPSCICTKEFAEFIIYLIDYV